MGSCWDLIKTDGYCNAVWLYCEGKGCNVKQLCCIIKQLGINVKLVGCN